MAMGKSSLRNTPPHLRHTKVRSKRYSQDWFERDEEGKRLNAVATRIYAWQQVRDTPATNNAILKDRLIKDLKHLLEFYHE